MSYLADLIGGKSETDLEKAIDRFFLYKGISSAADMFFDPNKRKRELEEKALSQYLDSSSIPDAGEVKSFLTTSGILKKHATSIANLLMRV